MGIVKFTSTRILPTGKAGILTPDENGYYTTVIGGLNCLNSKGEMYLLNNEVRQLFEQSSPFMRRIKKGVLKSELGHPKKDPGMTDLQFYQRILDIREQCVCAHISEVWLDENYGKNHPELKNSGICAIMGKVRPSGPYGNVLKNAMENPKENVCFSIRSLTEDRWERGRVIKTIKTIVTFDMVNEPGISIATKYDSPSLEDYSNNIVSEDLEEVVSLTQLKRLNEMNKKSVSNESTEIISDIIQTFIEKPLYNPIYKDWE